MTAPDRTVEVAPERLAGWLERFAGAHGQLTVTAGAERVDALAADGALARCHVPFPPLPEDGRPALDRLVAHALADRTVGVILVRRGGYAAGVFTGSALLASKVGSRHVQGRAAAGGWSQQRFARRRQQQARQAFDAAADAAARVLLPYADRLDAVVTGGDRPALASVLADARLAALAPLVARRVLAVPDPRQRVLEQVPDRYRAVRIEVTDQG